jgi:hypothetical protein
MPVEKTSTEIAWLRDQIAATKSGPRSVAQLERLAILHRDEFLAWQGVFKRAQRRTLWLAALAAGERSRELSQNCAREAWVLRQETAQPVERARAVA